MRAAARLGVALLVAGCAGLPEGLEPADREAFEVAAETLDCRLVTVEDYDAVAFQAALSREEVLRLAGAALGAGRAERLPEGGIRITAGPCAGKN
ncbi:hypothetical protein SAMN05216257_10676 [Meinhardsimonia xiamenensis]|jgi:hypothetical protein|uniref:Uncharacterized protein n=1 Tax=Meinhardsimonia xiamenensis TaxID=990712 RepID=A0A1G9G345_9RHOB|nr:hypothetical protein [Meinhardsimonia xiamenensis]PRX32701.1 hypothetical protein LV81_02462 [Meinhardsimonia xiamenensis]SDK95050.1 hypothetical protein SAMN05216257_10676 [Meinhardsimonia xiamenensis]